MTNHYSIFDFEHTLEQVNKRKTPFNELEAFLKTDQPHAQITLENRTIYCTGVEGQLSITLKFVSADVIDERHSRDRHEEITSTVSIQAPPYIPREPEEEEE
tara:strand:- start:8322 stop:8627 length:306 start_codon:yes stop_codon:yes gene_type:complete